MNFINCDLCKKMEERKDKGHYTLDVNYNPLYQDGNDWIEGKDICEKCLIKLGFKKRKKK